VPHGPHQPGHGQGPEPETLSERGPLRLRLAQPVGDWHVLIGREHDLTIRKCHMEVAAAFSHHESASSVLFCCRHGRRETDAEVQVAPPVG